ncbi:hypothetical protein C4544_04505 [candidate division WS5 bacterium]|uniref:Uncharacterized protein n=1 Tax=candidate division WS5 bacterium TaxID=2093353 RepID=A0A419DCA0_9BACT|nr:MAG: hypothetical protein C4544_04505 [candidate division WS5 bacterium]
MIVSIWQSIKKLFREKGTKYKVRYSMRLSRDYFAGTFFFYERDLDEFETPLSHALCHLKRSVPCFHDLQEMELSGYGHEGYWKFIERYEFPAKGRNVLCS